MEMPTYRPRDTISIDLVLRDESGVGKVSARFNRVGAGGAHGYLDFHGDGDGQAPEVTVTITAIVPEDLRPGEYRSDYVDAHDVRDNEEIHHVDMAFRIDAPEGDFEGPELVDWRFSEPSP
jgi:hypothetical protein